MDFINSVQNIQQKPRHVRQRILFISVAVCMAVIIVSWLMVASRRINVDMFNASNTETQVKTAASPFDMLKNIFTDALENIKTHAQK